MNENEKFLTSELILTRNNLLDVINWLKLGAYEILSEDEVNEYLNKHRFIYVNISKLAGLLDDGEWNWYIVNAGLDECKCSIKHKVSDLNLILPYRDQLSLGI